MDVVLLYPVLPVVRHFTQMLPNLTEAPGGIIDMRHSDVIVVMSNRDELEKLGVIRLMLKAVIDNMRVMMRSKRSNRGIWRCSETQYATTMLVEMKDFQNDVAVVLHGGFGC